MRKIMIHVRIYILTLGVPMTCCGLAGDAGHAAARGLAALASAGRTDACGLAELGPARAGDGADNGLWLLVRGCVVGEGAVDRDLSVALDLHVGLVGGRKEQATAEEDSPAERL